MCWEKTDGVRYLCVITQTKSYLIDRKYAIYEVKLEKLPINNLRTEFVHVFDGELVKDKGEDFIKFFIFDALVVDGENVMNRTFKNRLLTVKNKIIKKLRTRSYIEINKEHEAFDDEDDDRFKGPTVSDNNDVIKVYLKDLFLDIHTKYIYNNIVPNLDHGNDGIIYTMNDCPYYPGTWQQIIKWKPAVVNSADFSLKLITSYSDSEYIWGLYTRTFDSPEILYDCVFFSSAEENENWRKLVSKHNSINKPVILECSFNQELDYDHLLKFNKYKRLEQTTDLPKEENIKRYFKFSSELTDSEKLQLKGGWVIERQRCDKDFPNSLSVINNIKCTIDDPVTADDIIKYAESFKDKYEHRNGSSRKRHAEDPTQTQQVKMQKTDE